MTLVLSSRFRPEAGVNQSVYTIELENRGAEPVSPAALCVSGPARIDPRVLIEGARLTKVLSNHARLEPTDGLTLAPGARWTTTITGLGRALRHWNDGATGAYAETEDGTPLPVRVERTALEGGGPRIKGVMDLPLPTQPIEDAPVSIIPWPSEVSLSGSRPVPQGFALLTRSETGAGAAAAFAELTVSLFAQEAMVRTSGEGGFPVRLEGRDGVEDEAYSIAFETDAITVAASGHAGFLYGLITLGQIWRGARLAPAAFVFPVSGTIEDSPRFDFRGCHLDVARQFYPGAEVAKFLKIMAWNKLNRFHWHLSDDEAFRLELDAYPQIREIAGWRGHGLPVPSLLGSDIGPTGGTYSKDMVRDLVALGQSLGIDIIPEIDLPGHCFALIEALPELRDPQESGEYNSVQVFPNNCLNPAHEPVYRFIETLFDEMVELFPSKVIHIGADEVPLAAWSGSPLALDRLETLAGRDMREKLAATNNTLTNHHGADDIEGSPTAILQAEFLQRVHQMLTARGYKTGGWQEAAHGDGVTPQESYLVSWRDVETGGALAARGFPVVVSPAQRFYLDMANGPEFEECGAAWAGWSSPETTYGFDPTEGFDADAQRNLLGVQACIWSESMLDRAIFDRLVFPRLSAIAETGWTENGARSYPRFIAMAGLMPSLHGTRETRF